MQSYVHFLPYLAQFFLEWKKNPEKIEVDRIKTQILCSVTFFENSVVYKIIWKNIT